MKTRQNWLLTSPGLAFPAAAILGLTLLACNGPDHPEQRETSATPVATAASPVPVPGSYTVPSTQLLEKAQLLVTTQGDGALALRSPTFRCAPDYCAGAVVRGLEETLGKDNFEWHTAVIPDEEFVELRITFDPARFAVGDIVSATRRAMEAYPDPRYPGGVEVVHRD